MMHPSTRLQWISDDIGFGVIATEDLPMGTVTVAPDPLDIVMSREDLERLPEPLLSSAWHFMYTDDESKLILAWDHARYINHSCAANTMLCGAGIEIAIRDIKRGEEITTEYGLLRAQEELFHHCLSTSACRGVVGLNDYELYQDQWRSKTQAALERMPHVDQALEALLQLIPLKSSRDS